MKLSLPEHLGGTAMEVADAGNSYHILDNLVEDQVDGIEMVEEPQVVGVGMVELNTAA